MARKLISSGSTFEQEIGYSRAVVEGNWILVSGTTGFDYSKMTISDDLLEQAEQCFKNIEAALKEAGSSMKDVVRVTYVFPKAEDFEKCWPIMREYLGDVRPSAMMLAAGLSDPRMKIEIQVTAYCDTEAMTNSDLLYSQVPVEKINSIGHQTLLQEFREVGEAFLREFKVRCNLLPSSSFMDIGCGIGRLAIPLTDYLDATGRYEGFDITPDNVKWCQDYIAARHSNFCFKVADIFNHCYNPEGRYQAHEYVFPYLNGTFDVACAASVFTHLLAEDSERYLSETARVLKPGGYFLGTFFLLNEPSVTALRQQKSSQPFFHELKNCLVVNPQVPEAAVAYDEAFIAGIYRKVGLEVKEVHYGLWSGREPTAYGGYQDMIIARKIAS